jgi:hypothetical protein
VSLARYGARRDTNEPAIVEGARVAIFAVDPGTEQSALVTLDGAVISGHIGENAGLVTALRSTGAPRGAHLVIEEIESFGMAVGKETFRTVFWSGRFVQAWEANGFTWSLLPRRAVKLHLCGSMKAKDANIRQALIDTFGGIACTKKGGALYGIKSHLWAALAVAVTYRDTEGKA